MAHTKQELDKAFDAPKETISFWLFLAGLFCLIFLLWGKPVPFSNEFPYLLRLAKEAQPDFLLNDWTFSVQAKEHWLFNRVFSFPAMLLPVEAIGWIGRLTVWLLGLRILLKVGKLWQIPLWATAVSIAFWLILGQSLVGDEWVLGSFEAKTIAYIFLLSALKDFSRQKYNLPAVYLGLAFAFHPAVGMWGALAIGLALLGEKIAFKTLGKIALITAIFAAPGILPLAFEQFGARPDSAESWRYLALVRFPFHFDPFTFSRSATIFLFAMLVVNFAVFHRSASFAMRFLLKFQVALAAFFLGGFVLRWLELFELLRFLPVRLFPVFTPLFFAFTVFHFLKLPRAKILKILLLLFALMVIVRLNRIPLSFELVRNTYQSWTVAPDDFKKTSAWIAANTPNGVIVIQPPHRNDVWYLSQRACVASYAYQTFGRLDEWRGRIADLTGGNTPTPNNEMNSQIIEEAFNNLSINQINEIRKKYSVTYLVSRTDYPFPVVFQTETYKIYRLPTD